jgi:hypothetical protein
MGEGDDEWWPHSVTRGGTKEAEVAPCSPRRPKSAARRRVHRLAPGAIFLSVLVVLGAFIFVVMPLPAFGASTISGDGPQVCEHCPDGESGCIPNCGPPPPPCNPQYVDISIMDVSVTSSSTNGTIATVSWQESPDFSTTDTFLDWGNTTSQVFSQPAPYTGSTVTLTLNFLEPGTKYYFTIVANPASASCTVVYEPGSYSSSFTTASDSLLTISGTVSDQNGTSLPSSGDLLVVMHCTGWVPQQAEFGYSWQYEPKYWWNYTVTNSAGQYAFNVNYYGEPASYGNVCNGDGQNYVVQVINAHVEFGGIGPSDVIWPGVWNETVQFWSPQVVNFVLPMNYLTGYTPGIVDFSNAPADSGYTTLEVDQGAGYENSYTYDWSVGAQVVGIGGGSSGSTTAGTGVSAQIGWQATTGSLCVAYQYEVSGTIQFSSVSRSWAFNQTLFDAQNGRFCNQAVIPAPTNWFGNETNSNDDIHFMPGPENSSWIDGLQDVPLWKGDSIPYHLTISTSISATTGFNVDFGLSASLAGVFPLSFQASEGWSQTVTSGSTIELTYDIAGPSETAVSCYNVFGEGGSLSADSADMVAIYYWPGSVVNGSPVCT